MSTPTLKPVPLAPAPCPVVDDPAVLAERYADYCGDESRLRAETSAVFLPTTPQEVAGAFAEVAKRGWSAVLSGGRTGIAGGAVPVDADAVVTLERLKAAPVLSHDKNGWFVRVEPGVTLAELSAFLQDRHKAEPEKIPLLWLPVDPTEMSAHVGGAVAANASGARTFRYGPMRAWVRGLSVVLPDGRLLELHRDQFRAKGKRFQLENADGTTTDIVLPELALPDTKHTLGYRVEADMDLVDLFVGAEGTLGAIVAVELAVTPMPSARLGAMAVLDDETRALALVRRAREASRGNEAVRERAAWTVTPEMPALMVGEMVRAAEVPSWTLAAIEYFDPAALRFMKARRDADGPGGMIPALPRWDGAAVYLEFHGDDATIEEAAETLMEWLAEFDVDENATWAAFEPEEMEKQKAFRHAVPETVNAEIGRRARKVPGLHKVGTDMAVPDDKLEDAFALYREGLAVAGLEAVMFGHVGDNHIHVNILPHTLDELARAKELYKQWAKKVVSMGGAIAAEHGIGRLKKPLLAEQFPPEVLAAFLTIRKAFDPQGRLNPGVLV